MSTGKYGCVLVFLLLAAFFASLVRENKRRLLAGESLCRKESTKK
jgi:hypothetical protein